MLHPGGRATRPGITRSASRARWVALAGDDSCNSYDGRVLSTDPWKAPDLAMTAMGCVSGDNPLRARFTTLLGAATTARRDGADLVLDAPGSSELRFVRVAAPGVGTGRATP